MSSKRFKSRNVGIIDTDDVFVTAVANRELLFSNEVAQALCSKLNIETERVDVVSTEVGPLGPPCRTEKIVGDGNCFVRAISHAVSGTQKYHRKPRRAVVKHLRGNVSEYKNMLRTNFSSIEEYLSVSRMQYVGSLATELEIEAVANYLGVNVFTYHQGRWLEYGCNKQVFNQGVYLEHCNGNHYEIVVCVQKPQTQSCYGYCSVRQSCHSKYNTRQLKKVTSENGLERLNPATKEEVKQLHNTTFPGHVGDGIDNGNVRYSLSYYFKQKYNTKKKKKYQDDILFYVSFKESSRINYHSNELLREKKKIHSKTTYLLNKEKIKKRSKDRSKSEYLINVFDREQAKSKSIIKYKFNLLHRKRVQTLSIMKYRLDKLQRDNMQALSIEKYRLNKLHGEKVQALSIRKYKYNKLHREKLQASSITKYKLNTLHREKMRALSIQKYKLDKLHREKMRALSIKKYKLNKLHREKVQALSIRKYRLNQLHREKMRALSINKYHTDDEHKMFVKTSVSKKATVEREGKAV